MEAYIDLSSLPRERWRGASDMPPMASEHSTLGAVWKDPPVGDRRQVKLVKDEQMKEK